MDIQNPTTPKSSIHHAQKLNWKDLETQQSVNCTKQQSI
jgi:hypothetical protein